MNLPQIRLESQFIQHGLTIIKPTQDIQQPPAQLSIQQPHAIVSIQQPPAQIQMQSKSGYFEIDSSEARAQYGLKGFWRNLDDTASEAYNDWLSGIGRVAEQGDELMKIQQKGNTLSVQAAENSKTPVYDWNITFIPSLGSVQMQYIPAELQKEITPQQPIIDITPQKPIINVKVQQPIIDYTPGKVIGNIDKWNSLQISVVSGNQIDIKG